MRVKNSQLARYGFRGLGEDVPYYLAKASAPPENEAPYYIANPSQPHSEGNPYTVSSYVATTAPVQESNFLRAIPLIGDIVNAVVPNVSSGGRSAPPPKYGSGGSDTMLWVGLGAVALITVGGAVLLARSA